MTDPPPGERNHALAQTLALALEFGSLQCRGRCRALDRHLAKAASSPALWRVLDARVVYARLGAGANAFLAATLLPVFGAALEEVNLELCTRCDDAVLDAVARDAPHLLRLNLNALHGVSAGALRRVVAACPRLEVLQLYWHPKLPDGVLEVAAASAGPRLREVNVSGCVALTDVGLAALLDAAPRLAKLNVTRGLARYDALGGGACPNLRVLDCTGSRGLTGAAVRAVAETAGPRLASLNLSWCVAVDDEGVLGLADHCPNLELLSLHGSTHVSDAAVDALAASPAGASLAALDVKGCVRVTDCLRRDGVLKPKFPNVARWTLHS
ncbi:hypothetical protein JL720_7019 [Aureococcus anophagefferens]|nr:hypothetical protein JL720_7019 [Aureococcus anophagefferens]